MKEFLFTLGSNGGRHVFHWSQEAPRRRTVLNHGRLKRIETPWIQYMRYEGPLWDRYLAKLWIYASDAPVKTPDDVLHVLEMPHTAGSFCMGSGSYFMDRMAPEEIFWMSDFVDGNVGDEVKKSLALHSVPNFPILPRNHPSRGLVSSFISESVVPTTPRTMIDSFETTEHVDIITAAWKESNHYKRIQEEAKRRQQLMIAESLRIMEATTSSR